MSRRVVWKYAVPDGQGSFGLDLPAGHEFAGLTVQENDPYIYFAVDPDAEIWRCVFHARDTGQPLDVEDADLFRYLGNYATALLALGGTSVRHVWEEL